MPMAPGFAWARARARAWASRPGFIFAQNFSISLLRYLTWLPVAIVFTSNVAEPYKIAGPSMYPFFNKERNETRLQDWCMNWKWNAQDDLQRGMIVVFWNPLKPESRTVKRIVGLEGDIVRNRDSDIWVRVPVGHIWVEGDAGSRDSRDSNYYGPISARLVIGRLTRILFPFHRAGSITWQDHPDNPRVIKTQEMVPQLLL